MFSMRFLSVREVGPPSPREEDPPLRKMTWSVQTPGPRNSGFVELGDGDRPRPGAEKKKQEHNDEPAQDIRRSAAVSSPPLWPGEVEVRDKEGQDTVQIALVCDMEATATQPRETFRHSIATIDVLEFRRKPDEKFTFWQPLRPAEAPPSLDEGNGNHDRNSNSSNSAGCDGELGAIELSVTYYSDDCVDQGYWFALFCGLVPVPLILLWARDNDTNNSKSICSASGNNLRTSATPARDSFKGRSSNREKQRPDKIAPVIAPVAMDKRATATAATAAIAARPLQMRTSIEVL